MSAGSGIGPGSVKLQRPGNGQASAALAVRPSEGATVDFLLWFLKLLLLVWQEDERLAARAITAGCGLLVVGVVSAIGAILVLR